MDPELDDVLQDAEYDVGIDGPGAGFMAPELYDILFSVVPVLFILLFVGTVVCIVVISVRKARRYREAGIDPLTADVERDIRVMQALENRRLHAAPPTTSRAPTLEQRLDELDQLHRSGKITSAERDAARAKLLGTL